MIDWVLVNTYLCGDFNSKYTFSVYNRSLWGSTMARVTIERDNHIHKSLYDWKSMTIAARQAIKKQRFIVQPRNVLNTSPMYYSIPIRRPIALPSGMMHSRLR